MKVSKSFNLLACTAFWIDLNLADAPFGACDSAWLIQALRSCSRHRELKASLPLLLYLFTPGSRSLQVLLQSLPFFVLYQTFSNSPVLQCHIHFPFLFLTSSLFLSLLRNFFSTTFLLPLIFLRYSASQDICDSSRVWRFLILGCLWSAQWE